MNKGTVVWITGLSGVGKTTISRRLTDIFREQSKQCVLLDGDEIRRAFPDTHSGHDRDTRLINAKRNSGLAKLLSDQGFIVIIATMSLFTEIYEWNRENFSSYLEILVNVPMSVLVERDFNGLYSRAREGLINNVVGVDLNYDMPTNPDLILDNSGDVSNISMLARKIAKLLKD